MAKVTLKDVAERVGLSPTAVSLVLNGRPNKISAESRRRIHETARAMGYLPNQIARSLVTQRSQTLGLVLPNIRSRFFSTLAHDLEVRCRERGYLLLITNSDDDPANDADLVRLLVNRAVDGLLIVVADEFQPDPELSSLLEGLPVPCVMVDRYIDGFSGDVVRFDNRAGGRMACRHLIDAGHRRIACLANKASRTGQERIEGYREALEEVGLPYDPSLVFHTRYHIDEAYAASEQVLGTDATAVFATSDNIALGLLKRLHEDGVPVPDGISVVSYDNSAADSLFEPALTAIEQDAALLADTALDLLFAQMEPKKRGAASREEGPRISALWPRLVVKESVRRL